MLTTKTFGVEARSATEEGPKGSKLVSTSDGVCDGVDNDHNSEPGSQARNDASGAPAVVGPKGAKTVATFDGKAASTSFNSNKQ